MNNFWRYPLVLCTLIALASFGVVRRYEVPYPKPSGPTLDNAMHSRDVFLSALNKSNAELILVGDSVLARGIVPNELARLTQQSVFSIGIDGSASAAWYLILKNIVLAAPHKPRYLVILFRGTMLTTPDYRVSGTYFHLIDELATPKDKILIQKAYIEPMSPIERWADRYLPIYGYRTLLRNDLDSAIRYTPPMLFGCNTTCNDQANTDIFRYDNLDGRLFADTVTAAESVLYTPEKLDFDRQLNNSFLPDIVQLARENNIQLIFVRSKVWYSGQMATESAPLNDYFQKFETYASQNGAIVLDFSKDKRLTDDLYYDPLHTTTKGATVLTKLLAEALSAQK